MSRAACHSWHPCIDQTQIAVGFCAIKMGGSYLNAIVAGAVLGILPIVLDVVGFGMILNRGVTAGELSGIFSWAVIVFGTLIGAGFALSGESMSKMAKM